MRLGGLYRYPLKSGAAQAVSDIAVLPRGLAADRGWMVCDPQGRFITGRSHPRISLVQAQPLADGLQLHAPGMAMLHIPDTSLADVWPVSIWKQSVQALVGNAAADAWLSAWLGTSVRLARLPETSHRPVDPRYGRTGDEVSLADGFPLLLLGQASVHALNQRLEHPVGALHFRPNLIIEGCEAHAEDSWHRLRIGEVDFEVVKACTRCIFVNVDPQTASPDPAGEPLRTLGTYRRSDKGIIFGQNLIPRSDGRLRIGDPVIRLD